MTDLLWFYMDQSFTSQRGLKFPRTWLYSLVSVHALAFNIILALLTTYHTFAAGSWLMFSCSHRGLVDSTAESANYMSTRDNHIVGVMSHCESNESLYRTGT